MTKKDFSRSYWAVQVYGNLLLFLVLIGYACTAVIWARPLGNFLRDHFKDEGVVGLIAGSLFGIEFVTCFLLALLPFLWIDRRFGIKCPNCKRSLTLRCARNRVLRTGCCCFCHELLFQDT